MDWGSRILAVFKKAGDATQMIFRENVRHSGLYYI